MSVRQRITSPAPPAKRKTVTLSTLSEKKALGEPIVMVTAYDYPSASVAAIKNDVIRGPVRPVELPVLFRHGSFTGCKSAAGAGRHNISA